MKIAFCVSEDINLGAGYLIALLKKQGHDVRLFFDPKQFNRGYARNTILAKLLNIETSIVKSIKRYNPDMCCFSCVTASYQWALRLAEKVKKATGCKIVFGGVHPTLVPEEVKKHTFIDDVVIGSGFDYFGAEFNPDEIFPDREIFLKELPSEHRKNQLFMTSFGCPFNCSFCGNEQLRKVGKHSIIRRSVDGCINELKQLKNRGMKYVLFVDDIFTCDKNFLLRFLPEYRNYIDLPFACFIHPKFADSEVVYELKRSGCHTAWMGIQTGSENHRKAFLGRNESNAEIEEAAKLIKDAGIRLMVDHIFGLPYESNMTQDLSYLLYRKIMPDIVNCYELLYFPKARIIDYALQVGYLKNSDVHKIEQGKGVLYQTNNKGRYFYDMYAKSFVAIPLGGIVYELLPMVVIKLIAHIRAGRLFMPIAIIQNEVFFTWRCILKKLQVLSYRDIVVALMIK